MAEALAALQVEAAVLEEIARYDERLVSQFDLPRSDEIGAVARWGLR